MVPGVGAGSGMFAQTVLPGHSSCNNSRPDWTVGARCRWGILSRDAGPATDGQQCPELSTRPAASVLSCRGRPFPVSKCRFLTRQLGRLV